MHKVVHQTHTVVPHSGLFKPGLLPMMHKISPGVEALPVADMVSNTQGLGVKHTPNLPTPPPLLTVGHGVQLDTTTLLS
jgi:hypothetical protein